MNQEGQIQGSDQELVDKYKEYLNPNYAGFLERLGLATVAAKAEGSLVWDRHGRRYIDFVAGHGIFGLGHNPPSLLAALRRELDAHPLWNRPFLCAPLAELAEKLSGLAPAGLKRVFLCSSGAEAVDSALKLARLATRRAEIVSAAGAFHGFTLGALSVSGIAAQSRPFRPLLPGVCHVPFGDVGALSEAVTESTAAVLLEPIQAEIGAMTPPRGYLAAARDICDRSGALLLVDEVRTGMGRTGPLFAVEDEGVSPDVLVLGKSLAGGIVPVGAIVAQERLWGRFGLSFAMSASSFAGNRLACVAALETLALVQRDDILGLAMRAAKSLRAGLKRIAADCPDLVERVTGKGLLLGLHLVGSREADQVVRRCIEDGLLAATAFCNSRCLLIEPPLTIEPGQLAHGLDILKKACHKVTTGA